METNLPSKPSEEEFEEIDNTQFKPNLKENVSLLDRGKGSKKQSRANSPSPSISAASKLNMTRDQVRYCGALMRNLKRHRDAVPFLHPVDYVKLNVPDYPKVIKHPMDLNTIDKKLINAEYDTVEEFVSDIRLVFKNCYKFNGPEAMISMLCQNVESAFEKSLRQMPPSRGNTPPPRSPASDAEDDLLSSRRPSKKTTSSPRDDGSRPKREIHPPPSKDYPEPMTKRRNPRKNDIQLKFCMQTLRELKKNKYRDINYPFLQPVDVVALNIPDYVDIIKHPMDLSTIETKLNEGAYDEPEDFERDVRLMFNNCYTYNPATLPVHKMGRELERVFDEKWAKKPEPVVDEVEDDFSAEESDEDDRDQKIAELERHIATISQQIVNLKSQKKQKKAPVRRPPPKKPSTGGAAASGAEKRKRVTKKKEGGQVGSKTTPKRPSAVEEFPEFTFDQKKDLSDRINNLQGDDLNTVVQIIQNSMPNLNGQGQDEIVLDIDSLDRRTLHKLHKFVTGESLTSKPPSKKAKTQYKDKPLHKYSDNDSSSESDSDSSSGSDSDDSGSSSD